ncbi:MAG: hypothetical protein IT538_04560 [Variibacter sp.]|nr:hypothetical protein [Variibacter sp.]
MTLHSQSDPSPPSSFIQAFFAPEIKAWRGERPLWIVFWVYGAAASTAFGLLYIRSLFGQHILLEQALLPSFAAYTFWVIVSLWRSSAPISNTLWGALARQVAVVWALNAILMVTFLQIELMKVYVGASVPTLVR